jgi:plasmid stability protein
VSKKTQVEKEKEAGYQRLTVLLPKDVMRELKVLAAKKDTSMMDLARAAIKQYLRSKE